MNHTQENQRTLDQLRLALEAMPEWAEPLSLQIALYEESTGFDLPPIECPIGAAEATQRRRDGVPLITPVDSWLDWHLLKQRFDRICTITKEMRPDLKESIEQYEDTVAPDGMFQERTRAFMVRVDWDDGDLNVPRFLHTHAMRPFLQQARLACTHLVDPTWRRNYCPVCAGEPDMAALTDEDEGARILLCSRCDMEWRFPRTGCVYCVGDKHHSRYFPVADSPHRIYVCDDCKRYLKAIDLRQAPGKVILPVERVLTIHLDVTARNEGFS